MESFTEKKVKEKQDLIFNFMAITKLLKVEGNWVDMDDLNRILEKNVN